MNICLSKLIVAPRLADHMGPVFEHICRTFVARSGHARLPFLPDRIGEWWTDDGQHQIDVVALGVDGDVLLGECKWGRITFDDLALFEHRRDLIGRELRGTRRVHLPVFCR